MESKFITKRRVSAKPAVALLLCLTAGCGTQAEGPPAEGTSISYEPYAKVLSAYVDRKGFVDYRGLQADRRDLDAFVANLATISPQTVAAWTDEERLSFWMNTYNALTLRAVVDHYPVKSIRDIGSLVKSVWDTLRFEVMGQTLTLNQIEHEILRKEFAEPRIHLAINCASIGCPPLAAEPLRAGRLDEQFDGLTRRFLAVPSKFRINRDEETVHLSPIFKWFGEDFEAGFAAGTARKKFNRRENAVLNYVAQHLDAADAAYIDSGAFKLKWQSYDWGLNEQP